MSLTESRLTRTSATTGSRARGELTSAAQGDGRLVRAAVRLATARRAAGRWADAAARFVADTVRPAGVLVALAATAGLVLGLVFGWVEWTVAGVIALILLAMSVPFLFGARSYAVDLRLAHERIVAGDPIGGGVVVRNEGRRLALPGRIDIPVGQGLVEVGVPLLRPGHVIEEVLDIPPQRRGIVAVGPATTVRSDPIGLLRREHAFADVHELYVHPRTASLPAMSTGLLRDLDGDPTRRLVDADMSFHAIREYAPGDSQRQIHWKSTAKTGRLMVRQYEESRRARLAIVLGAAEREFADAEEFELAVSCAASLGVRAVRDARDLDIVVGEEIPRVVRGRLRSLRHLPTASPRALLDGFSGVDRRENVMAVEEVCRLAVEASERLSVAFVVVGSPVSFARLRRAALAFAADTTVVGVVCDERAHPRLQTLAGMTVLTVGTLDDFAGLLLHGASS
jgi:uncharacterized protein (DUF58 family)